MEIASLRLRLIICDLPVPGLYFPDHGGEPVICIDRRQPAAVRRSAAAEELAHHLLGHYPTADPIALQSMELRARRWAAERLVRLEHLAEAMVGASSWEEVAESLEVSTLMLDVRVAGFTDREHDQLMAMVGEREIAV